jgi:ribosomal protein L11
MIFILLEQVFNGSVTMSVSPTGVEANSFKEAVTKVKKELKTLPHKVEIKFDDDDKFQYSIEHDLVGRMKKTPLKIL